MTLILIAIAAVVIFFIGLFSPRKANQVQDHTNKKAKRLKSATNWFWDPVTFVTKGSVSFSRKVIVSVSEWGKKLRSKLPF